MSKIDIIIPLYKGQDVIENALASIMIQSISKDCKVIIINDADGIDYTDQFEMFNDKLDIDVITLSENGGPGIARQVGIDYSSSPYIVFLDADDIFFNPFALEIMFAALEKYPGSPVAMGNFVEVIYNPNLEFLLHKEDFVWMFAKLYRREYLEKYNIRFNGTRANEDNGFNTIVQLCMGENEECIITINETLYTWNFNRESITRKDNYEYTYNQNVIGYTENMIYALNHVKRFFPMSEKIVLKSIEIMINLYVTYEKTLEFKPKFKLQNWENALRFYKEEFEEISQLIEPLFFKQEILKTLKSKDDMMKDFIPKHTFYQFLSYLEDDS